MFIDEIDAIGKGRDSRIRSGGNEEREQTLNQLLTELDGFDSNKENTVICIAATNRPDVLDSALLRPGRFDRRISVEPPDRIGRLKILESHVRRRELPLAPGVDLGGLAAATTGESAPSGPGKLLQNICLSIILALQPFFAFRWPASGGPSGAFS